MREAVGEQQLNLTYRYYPTEDSLQKDIFLAKDTNENISLEKTMQKELATISLTSRSQNF